MFVIPDDRSHGEPVPHEELGSVDWSLVWISVLLGVLLLTVWVGDKGSTPALTASQTGLNAWPPVRFNSGHRPFSLRQTKGPQSGAGRQKVVFSRGLPEPGRGHQ